MCACVYNNNNNNIIIYLLSLVVVCIRITYKDTIGESSLNNNG